MEPTLNNPVSQEELILLAIKLKEDLYNYEEQLGSCQDFAVIKDSADALIVAILEPVEFLQPDSLSKKTAQSCQPPRRGASVIPISLH